jgi:hypothetical protein
MTNINKSKNSVNYSLININFLFILILKGGTLYSALNSLDSLKFCGRFGE